MALGDHPCEPLFTGGKVGITAKATAAITNTDVGGKFVAISGTPDSGPALGTGTDGGNIKVATCGAAARAFGVAAFDAAASGDKIGVHPPGFIVPMIAGTGGITAGQEVEAEAGGNPITLASGKSNGIAINTAAAGATVYVRLH